MSLVQGFKIRYGNADELDNYDPTIDVYENQSFIGGTQYNIFQRPQFDSTTERTILNDEIGDNDPNRLIVSNRCLIGDGVSTLDVEGNLTGAITAKSWTTTSVSGGWALNDLTLSGGVLTLASGTYYKTIERYVNGVLYDHVPLEDIPSGFDNAQTLSTTGESLTLTSSDYTLIRTVRDDIPWESSFGDRYGYSLTKSFAFDELATPSAAGLESGGVVVVYNGDSSWFSVHGGTGNSLSQIYDDPNGDSQLITTINGETLLNIYKKSGSSYFGSGAAIIGVNNVDLDAATLTFDVTILSGEIRRLFIRDNSVSNDFISFLDNLKAGTSWFNIPIHNSLGKLFECLNGGAATSGTGFPNGGDDDTPWDTYGMGTANGYVQDWTSTDFRNALKDAGISNVGEWLQKMYDAGYNNTASSQPNYLNILIKGGEIQINESTVGRHYLSYDSGDFGAAFHIVYDIGYYDLYDSFFLKYNLIQFQHQTNSSVDKHFYINNFFIAGINILPVDEDDKTEDAVNNEPLTYDGKKQFQAYRLNNQAAYFDTDTALIPISGNISGATITDTYGTATFSISGNAIACTTSGSCHGIRLDSGEIYTMSEGYYGNGSDYIYDASSASGVNLTISGQTAAQTWQQATGQTDFGYDWLSIYGGHRYRAGNDDPSKDIFIPHIVNTDSPVTESLLPSGYYLRNDMDRGVFVRPNSEWLLASGQVSQYRSELDAHVVGTTAFTENKGHYVTENSVGNFTRWVIYPENLSEPANTVVDFDNDALNPVTITYQTADVATLSQMNGSYTKRIKLPATKQNSDLFDYIYDPNNKDFGTLKNKKDCEISVDGVEILRGKGIVEAVVKKDIAESYDLYVQGDNFNLFDSLDEIAVSGLDLGSFVFSQGNVENSWDYTAASGNVVFAPIDYGQIGTGGVCSINDLTPSFFIRNLLTKSFEEIGIAYESEWLDSDYGKRLVLPFVGEWRLSDSDYATASGQNYFSAYDNTLYTVSGNAATINTKRFLNITQVTANPNYNPTGALFTVPDAVNMGLYLEIDIKLTGSYPPNGEYIQIGYQVNGNEIENFKTYSVVASDFRRYTVPIDRAYNFQAGDAIRPYIKTPVDIQYKNVTWRSDVKYKIAEEQTLTLNSYIPQPKNDTFTAFDILKGLAQTFNLHFYYNPSSKILKFEPYPDFWGNEVDLTDKWDNSKPAEMRYLGLELTQDIWHKFKEDENDRYLDEYKRSGVEYGSYKLELPNNFKKGETVVRNEVFAPTIEREKSFGTIPVFNYESDNENVESLDFQLRILYYEGKDTSGTFKMATGQVTQTTVNNYAYLPRLAFRVAKTGATWQSLAYDSTDDRVGLFETYYVPKYRNIYEGITATYYLNLTSTDIINEILTKTIYLDGSRWYINKIIDFNPISEEATKVELIKAVDFNIPTRKTPQGTIDIITGKRIDPVSYKPNRDLPDNPGFDFDIAPSGFVQGDEDAQGSSFGADHRTPKRSNTFAMGRGLTSYWSNQYLFGTWNEPNEDAILQVGAGTGSGEQYTAFEVVRGDLGYDAKLSGDRVLIGESYEVSGYQARSTKFKHGTVDISSGSGYLDLLNADGSPIFSTTPIITLTLTEYTESSNFHYYVKDVTVSGCNVYGFKGAAGMTQTFNYIAIGQ